MGKINNKISKKQEANLEYFGNVFKTKENVVRFYELFFPAESIASDEDGLSFEASAYESIPLSTMDGQSRKPEDIVMDLAVRKAMFDRVRTILSALYKQIEDTNKPAKEPKKTPTYK